MEVQTINKQNNIVHKAYFKPNAEFKKLYGNHKVLQEELIKKFTDLPNHELEILKLTKLTKGYKFEPSFTCEVFNNNTKKALGIGLHSLTGGLNELLEAMVSWEGLGLFKENNIKNKKYELLTTKK